MSLDLAAILAPGRNPAGWAGDLTAWADHLARTGKSETTAAGYLLHLSWLARDLHDQAPHPWDLTAPQLTAWLDAQNWSTPTRRKVLGSLRGFYTWGMVEGLCRRSPLAGVATVPPRPSGPQLLPVPPAWAEPVEAWTTWQRASNCTTGTLRVRRFWLRQLAETYADPWAVTPADLALFMSRDDWAPETKRGARTALRLFYSWAVRAGRITASPAADLPPVRIPRSVPRPASDDAVSLAFATADDRTRLALALACYAGLRRAEVASVHARDIGTDTLRVKGKGGHERLVPLHPELSHLLAVELRRRRQGDPGSGWPRDADPAGWLFPSPDPSRHLTPGHVGKLIDRALPRGYTPHILRHRFGTQAYAASRDLRAVQELLGHANPATTMRYAAVPSGALLTAVHGIPTAPTHPTIHTDPHGSHTSAIRPAGLALCAATTEPASSDTP